MKNNFIIVFFFKTDIYGTYSAITAYLLLKVKAFYWHGDSMKNLSLLKVVCLVFISSLLICVKCSTQVISTRCNYIFKK